MTPTHRRCPPAETIAVCDDYQGSSTEHAGRVLWRPCLACGWPWADHRVSRVCPAFASDDGTVTRCFKVACRDGCSKLGGTL